MNKVDALDGSSPAWAIKTGSLKPLKTGSREIDGGKIGGVSGGGAVVCGVLVAASKGMTDACVDCGEPSAWGGDVAFRDVSGGTGVAWGSNGEVAVELGGRLGCGISESRGDAGRAGLQAVSNTSTPTKKKRYKHLLFEIIVRS